MRVQTLRKRAAKRSKERGVALIMVLLAIAVLSVFLTDAQQESSATLSAAVADRDRLKAEYNARSAVNLARMLISTEPTIRAAVSPMYALINRGARMPQIPVWAFSDQLLGVFNDSAGNESFKSFANIDTSTGENLGLGGDGRFEIVIVDEDSKLNVNTAARGDIISRTRLSQQLLGLLSPQQYNPLFENPDSDGQLSNRQSICSAIIDWADSDQNLETCDPASGGPVSGGAEDNFYQSIGLGYFRKNAAFDSLEELRLIRGVGDDFWATFVDPNPRDPQKRIMTVWGQGKVNVNTANAQTLWALVCAGAVVGSELCVDPMQAQAFLTFVGLARGLSMGAPLFGSSKDFVNTLKGSGMVGPMLATMGVKPVQFKSDSEMRSTVTTKSKMFSIYAQGVVKGFKRETRVLIHSVVDFRHATKLSALQPSLSSSALGPAATGAAASAGATGQGEGMLAALKANPAGNIVYWRIE
jgi:general secretion pathway protein K